jgi:hypothetical protein
MDTSIIVAIAVGAAIVVLVAAAVVSLVMRRRDGDLESRYGAEYEREIKLRGRRKAETELAHREERVSSYSLRELDPEERSVFSERWTAIQAEFVDAPRTALQHADVLLQEVMTARGYPMADFEQRAADLSVEYGEVVRNYRAAQSIAQRGSTASTEDLRRAMLMQRKMFESLLRAEMPVQVERVEHEEQVLEEIAV